MNYYWFNKIEINDNMVKFIYNKRVVVIPFSKFYCFNKVKINNKMADEILFNQESKIYFYFKKGQLLSLRLPMGILSLLKNNINTQIKYSRISNEDYHRIQNIYIIYRKIIIIISILFILLFLFGGVTFIIYYVISFFLFILMTYLLRKYFFNKVPKYIDIIDGDIIVDCKWERYFINKPHIKENKYSITFVGNNKSKKFYCISNNIKSRITNLNER